MLITPQCCPAIEQTRKITDIMCTDGTQRFVPLPSEDYLPSNNGSARYIDREMHPKVKKAQNAHNKKPWNRRRR